MLRLCSLLAALLIAGGVAQAAGPELTDAARAHYLAGSEDYRRGDYGEALTEFQKSYDLSKRPELLFNIGMCQAKRGHLAEAEGLLRQFLATSPQPQDRLEAEAQLDRVLHLEQLEQFERMAAERSATLQLRASPAQPETAPPPATERSFARRHRASLLAGGLAVTALVVMTATSVGADSAFSNAGCDGTTHLCISRASLESAQQLAITSDVLLGLGIVGGAAAIVLAILETRRPSLLALRSRGAGLQVTF